MCFLYVLDARTNLPEFRKNVLVIVFEVLLHVYTCEDGTVK